MSTTILFLGVLFGSVGLGYSVYGRRQRAPVPFVSGLLLMALPYFISNVAALVVAGVVIGALPFVIRR